VLEFALVLLGSMLPYVGACLVLLLLPRALSGPHRDLALFAILTAAMIAVGRAESGIETAIQGRYRIWSALFLATCLPTWVVWPLLAFTLVCDWHYWSICGH